MKYNNPLLFAVVNILNIKLIADGYYRISAVTIFAAGHGCGA